MEKRVPSCTVGENAKWSGHSGKGSRILKNLKTELPYDLAKCATRYLPQRYRASEKKGHLHPNVHCSNVHSVEGAIYPSTDEWIKKLWSIDTMGY